jgi:serine protease Do
MSRTFRRVVVGGVLVLSIAGGISIVTGGFSRAMYAIDVVRADAARASLADVGDLSFAFKEVFKAVRPSVVSIRSSKVVRGGVDGIENLPPEFREFFRSPFFSDPRDPGVPRDEKREGLGSGFIISEDGYVVTNHHVIDGADEVNVKLSNGSEHKAKIIGSDPKTDIALLRIDASGLAPVVFGDSNRLEVGEWVVAVGHPFGLTQTLTAGIVSATGRGNVGIVDYGDFIQTDAAINPGNSGGPLLDLTGRVVGMNTAIFSRSGGSMGIGFAIPSSMVQRIKGNLLDEGRVIRGYLGLYIQDLNPGLAKSFGRSGTDGALVGRVAPGGPADRAGLREGDLILAIGDHSVTNADDLRNTVAAIRPGIRSSLRVLRDGDEKTIEVEIGELPDSPSAQPDAGTLEDLGWTLRERRSDGRTGRGETEVVVTGVKALSKADDAGLEPGDVILEIQGDSITNIRDVNDEISRAKERGGARILVRRGEGQVFLYLELD